MQMCEKVLQISSTAMVCDTCRKRLSKKKHQYYLQLSLMTLVLQNQRKVKSFFKMMKLLHHLIEEDILEQSNSHKISGNDVVWGMGKLQYISSLFKYPEQDVCSVPLESILILFDPQTRTSCVYTLSKTKSLLLPKCF